MARYENKSLSVVPEREQETIDRYIRFGWELQNSQEVFNRDSHLEDRADGLYSVTTTTNYIKLLFRRDTEMPHYEEIRAIERDYEALEPTASRLPEDLKLKWKILIPALLLLPGILAQSVWLALLGPALGVGFVLLYHFFIYNPRFQKWGDARAAMSELEEKLAKITEE